MDLLYGSSLSCFNHQLQLLWRILSSLTNANPLIVPIIRTDSLWCLSWSGRFVSVSAARVCLIAGWLLAW
jgi:hypothetical protein